LSLEFAELTTYLDKGNTTMTENRTQNEIDNQANNASNRDTKIGAELGGAGGVVTGAVAGSMAGPVGTVVGAVVGGIAGAVASGAAVHAVDKIDDDDTISGIGHHTKRVAEDDAAAVKNTVNNALPGNKVPGIQTGGHDIDGSPDTRGITEKAADAITGDRIDDKTGKPVD
jgi:phage tail tape-measure protein